MTDLWNSVSALIGSLPSRPTLVLMLVGIPLAFLAWRRRIYPGNALIAWSLVPCVATAGLFLRRDVLPVVLAMDAVLVAFAIQDLFRLPGRESFSVHRECQRIASLRKKHAVTLTISNSTSRSQVVSVRDGISQEFETNPEEFHVTIPPRSRAVLNYELKATRRGAFELDAIHLNVHSRFGLWKRLVTLPYVSTINVYPDLKQLSEYALLARTNRLRLLGVRRTRRVGQDNEFERLRDYSFDDHYKHIDWRSTARRNKLTVKDFQSDQSQRVMFMVDCGRMMTNEAAGLSLLDHAFNAALMLAYVALKQGDAVGLISFSDRIHSSVPARAGRNQMNRLLHAAYDRFPQLVESRYEDAFLHLSERCRKRSLVVLMTNVIDDVNSAQVSKYATSLARQHLPVCVILRDRQMFDAVDDAGDASPASLFRGAAAASVLGWRHQVISDLEHQGVLVVDEFPERLTAPLINRYLEVKARHLL